MILLQKYKHRERSETNHGQAHGHQAVPQPVKDIVKQNQKKNHGQAHGQQAVYLAVENVPEPKSPRFAQGQRIQRQK